MADPAHPDPGVGRRFKLVLLVAPALAFMGVLAFAIATKGSAPVTGEVVADFSAERLDGSGPLSLSDLRGRPVFVNFWWSGCVPCEDEAPILSRAHDLYGDRVQFLGVNVRDAKSDAIAFATKHRLGFEHVRDESLDIYRMWGLTGQPESFFIDHNGVLVAHIAGPVTDESLVQYLDVLVARDA